MSRRESDALSKDKPAVIRRCILDVLIVVKSFRFLCHLCQVIWSDRVSMLFSRAITGVR